MNRRIPNGTYGGVRGRELGAPSYSIIGMNAGSNKLPFSKGVFQS
ncbi:hypothetical protein MHI37_01985 [Paenibacillus sp. FSL H8-0548]|nr:hypothetical protein [Paenibacillus sp. FSL H8-0548]